MAIIGVLGAPYSFRKEKGRKLGSKQVARKALRRFEEHRNKGDKVVLVLHFKVAGAWRKLGYPDRLIYEEVGKLPGGTVLNDRDTNNAALELFEGAGVVQFDGLLDDDGA